MRAFFDAHDQVFAISGPWRTVFIPMSDADPRQAESRTLENPAERTSVDEVDRTVNATKFMRNLGGVLKAYCRYAQEDSESDLWKNCRKEDGRDLQGINLSNTWPTRGSARLFACRSC